MTIVVCPLSQVGAVIEEWRPGRVISLLDPDTPFPETAIAEHLRVHVHDINQDEDGWIAPAQLHVDTLLGFIRRWDRRDPMLVHCYAGISRSTATAFIAACLHNPNTDEREIAQELRLRSPTATPNRRLVQLADLEMGRKGRMLHAVESIGRGSTWLEIGEAEPFAMHSEFE